MIQIPAQAKVVLMHEPVNFRNYAQSAVMQSLGIKCSYPDYNWRRQWT